MFKPTKQQVQQAWDDIEEGRPVSKDMRLHLEAIERLEMRADSDRIERMAAQRRANEGPQLIVSGELPFWFMGLFGPIPEHLLVPLQAEDATFPRPPERGLAGQMQKKA